MEATAGLGEVEGGTTPREPARTASKGDANARGRTSRLFPDPCPKRAGAFGSETARSVEGRTKTKRNKRPVAVFSRSRRGALGSRGGRSRRGCPRPWKLRPPRRPSRNAQAADMSASARMIAGKINELALLRIFTPDDGDATECDLLVLTAW